MTTSVLTVATTQPPRPVPWRRLVWVAWRRYRTTLLATLGLLAVVAAYLLLRGHQMRDEFASVQACAPQSSAGCRFAFARFRDAYASAGLLGALLVWLPAVIGAFAGAPLLARELETGTFRYTWTQGVGRTRWVLGVVVAGAIGVAALAASLGGLMGWYDHALVVSGVEQRLHASLFPLTGVAVVGWALVAFAIGVLAGLLSRRVLAAVALTLAAWTGLAFLAAGVLRPHYLAPLVTSGDEVSAGDLEIQQWWSHGGVRVSDAQVDRVLQSIGAQPVDGGTIKVGPGTSQVDPVQYLVQHGYTQWTSYQPDSRYWPFQWVELGWLTLLSVVLLATAVWLVRRRPA